MAFVLSNNDYSGSFDPNKIISPAMFKTKTFAGNYVTLIPGVKDSTNLPMISATAGFKDESCGWSASGDIALGNKKIEVKQLEVKKELCTKDLLPHYYSALMRVGAKEDDIPFQNWLAEYQSNLQAVEFERLVWSGTSNSVSGQFKGLYYTISADTNAIVVTANTLTEANIIGEVKRVYSAIPSEILDRKTVKIFISYAAAKLYNLATTSSGVTHDFSILTAKPLSFLDIELVPVPVPTNVMIAAEPGNLFAATDLGSDIEDVQVIDKRKDGEDLFRFKAKVKGGTNIGLGTEIVIYR